MSKLQSKHFISLAVSVCPFLSFSRGEQKKGRGEKQRREDVKRQLLTVGRHCRGYCNGAENLNFLTLLL